jgi:hypothetical protein
MEIVYTSRFQKDIEHVSNTIVKKDLLFTIEEIKKAENLLELHQVKKMKVPKMLIE